MWIFVILYSDAGGVNNDSIGQVKDACLRGRLVVLKANGPSNMRPDFSFEAGLADKKRREPNRATASLAANINRAGVRSTCHRADIAPRHLPVRAEPTLLSNAVLVEYDWHGSGQEHRHQHTQGYKGAVETLTFGDRRDCRKNGKSDEEA